MTTQLFNFNGFAAATDLEDHEWRGIFAGLEKKQQEFLSREGEFRSKEYAWPRDPLHTWSRVWEYPYVFHHIQKIQATKPSERLRIVDFGSGVTFFPFAVAELGCYVTCVDIDPVVAVDVPEAVKHVRHSPGSVNVKLVADHHIPIESSSQDIVYCISVLEHIPDFDSVIDEMARVLRPGGELILTVDIDLRGNYDLGVKEFSRLQAKLRSSFTAKLVERAVHPCNLLTTESSPFRMNKWSYWWAIKRFIKGILRGRVDVAGPLDSLFLAVHSGVFVRS